MIDLHVHSTSSDGFYSPLEIVDMALDIKLEALALTDHDAIAGVEELKKAAKGKNIEIINGAELSVYYPDTDMEVIALNMPDKNMKEFKKFQEEEFIRRKRVTDKRLSILQGWGYDISYEEVAFDEKGNERMQIRRPHFVDVLLKKGYIKTTAEAYKTIFVKGGGSYVENRTKDVKDVIRFIKDNGGVAILAHPVHTKKVDQEIFDLFVELKGYGLDGVEVFHSSQSSDLRKKYLEMIKELGLITAGGSDFHGGTAHPENKLGTGKNNNLNIPYMVLEEILNFRTNGISANYYSELEKYI
jgi:predicted metal-dependent phosphoesterase TrpH